MNRTYLLICCGLGAGLLSACVEMPSAPTVAVMPAPYKPFEVFKSDDQICRGYAQQEISGQPAGSAANSGSATTSDYSYGYLQYRYNLTYEQCMYSKGNQVQNFTPPASTPPPPTAPSAPSAPSRAPG